MRVFHFRFAYLLAAGLMTAGPALAETSLSAASTLATNREMSVAFVRYFVDPLNQRAKGRIHVDFKGGPEVMPPGKQATAVGRGVLDITYSPAAYYAGQVPEGNLIQVSNMTPAEIRKSGAFAMLDQVHQKKLNVKFLAWGDSSGAFNTYLTVKPIINADGSISLKGYKMRSTATYRPLFEFLHAISVSMPAGDIYTGLQRGVIQGFGSPSSGLVALGIKGLVKYRIDPTYYRLNNYVLMNLDKWKALSQADKDLVDAVAQSYEVDSAKAYVVGAKEDEKQLVAGGMQVVTLKGAAAQRYVDAANVAVLKRIAKEVGDAEVSAYKAKLIK